MGPWAAVQLMRLWRWPGCRSLSPQLLFHSQLTHAPLRDASLQKLLPILQHPVYLNLRCSLFCLSLLFNLLINSLQDQAQILDMNFKALTDQPLLVRHHHVCLFLFLTLCSACVCGTRQCHLDTTESIHQGKKGAYLRNGVQTHDPVLTR